MIKKYLLIPTTYQQDHVNGRYNTTTYATAPEISTKGIQLDDPIKDLL